MREEITYQWSCQQFGKWYTTSFHCTEEHIRKEYPEAVCVTTSRVARMVPSTPEEERQAMIDNSPSAHWDRTALLQKTPQMTNHSLWRELK